MHFIGITDFSTIFTLKIDIINDHLCHQSLYEHRIILKIVTNALINYPHLSKQVFSDYCVLVM